MAGGPIFIVLAVVSTILNEISKSKNKYLSEDGNENE
jgi:hypothetical protein